MSKPFSNLWAKKQLPRKTPQQIESEVASLKDCVRNIREAEEALLGSDFYYGAELTALGRIREALTNKVNSLEQLKEQKQP